MHVPWFRNPKVGNLLEKQFLAVPGCGNTTLTRETNHQRKSLPAQFVKPKYPTPMAPTTCKAIWRPIKFTNQLILKKKNQNLSKNSNFQPTKQLIRNCMYFGNLNFIPNLTVFRATFFAECHIPLTVVESDAFLELFQATCPSYKPPSRSALRDLICNESRTLKELVCCWCKFDSFTIINNSTSLTFLDKK